MRRRGVLLLLRLWRQGVVRGGSSGERLGRVGVIHASVSTPTSGGGGASHHHAPLATPTPELVHVAAAAIAVVRGVGIGGSVASGVGVLQLVFLLALLVRESL